MRVQYIGPDEAILAGTYILEGEVRDVTPSQLAAAQRDHPHGFVVLDEPPTDEPPTGEPPAGEPPAAPPPPAPSRPAQPQPTHRRR